MKEVLRIDTVAEHDAFYYKENRHPLVSIMDFEGRVWVIIRFSDRCTSLGWNISYFSERQFRFTTEMIRKAFVMIFILMF